MTRIEMTSFATNNVYLDKEEMTKIVIEGDGDIYHFIHSFRSFLMAAGFDKDAIDWDIQENKYY